MTTSGVLTTIGLMSGTSMDGVDAAVIHTDGERIFGFGPTLSIAYEDEFQGKLRAALGFDPIGEPGSDALALELTHHHVSAVNRLLAENGLDAGEIDVIGFHGHTVLHQPDLGLTRQIGNGGLLARDTGIPVIDDFRSQDVAGGGEGAPLAPVFHAALAHDLDKPLAVLNIGGVANVTWISPDGGLIAFDTGPGNALIDDWVRQKQSQRMDKNGLLAHAGAVDEEALSRLLDHPFFSEPYPKSLDRDEFEAAAVQHLSVADGAATLTAFTAGAVEKAAHLLPSLPNRWLVTGGGRHNPAMMAALRAQLSQPVEPVEIVGWQGDALEAQAFGFLAARSLKGLPLSLPSTTGVSKPMPGGTLHRP